MGMNTDGHYYPHDGTTVVGSGYYLRSQLSGLKGIAAATSDDEVYAAGYAKAYWVTTVNPYGRFANAVLSAPTLDEDNKRCVQVQSWKDIPSADKRAQIESEINEQVPQYSATDLIVDNEDQEEVNWYAEHSLLALNSLSATLDEALDSFDSSLPPFLRPVGLPGVAKAPPMTWALMYRSEHEPGKVYLTNTMCRDEGWVGTSKRTTTDPIAPQPKTAWAFYLYGMRSPAWEPHSTETTMLIYGYRITATKDQQFAAVSLWAEQENVAAGLEHQLFKVTHSIDGMPQWELLEAFTPTEVGWQDIILPLMLVRKGEVLDLLVELRSPFEVKTVSGQYDYRFNHWLPQPGQIVNRMPGASLRMHYVDKNGADEEADIRLTKPGDQIFIACEARKVVSAVYHEDHAEFIVTPKVMLSGGTYQVEIKHFGGVPIAYSQITNATRGRVDMEGLLAVGDTDLIAPDDHGYGLDIWLREVTFSDDWDLLPIQPEAILGSEIDIEPKGPHFSAVLEMAESADSSSYGYFPEQGLGSLTPDSWPPGAETVNSIVVHKGGFVYFSVGSEEPRQSFNNINRVVWKRNGAIVYTLFSADATGMRVDSSIVWERGDPGLKTYDDFRLLVPPGTYTFEVYLDE